MKKQNTPSRIFFRAEVPRKLRRQKRYPGIKSILWFALLFFVGLLQAQLPPPPPPQAAVHFDMDRIGTHENPDRKQATSYGKRHDISIVVDGKFITVPNRKGTKKMAQSFYRGNTMTASRFKIADLAGTDTTTSFFGTTLEEGHDLDKFTISCWVYVKPDEEQKRYLFYGTRADNSIGFGLGLKGEDLFLVKYANNATATPGHRISTTVIGPSWEVYFLGPATFSAGTGWYHVILIQGEHYTRIYVGTPPEYPIGTEVGGRKNRFNTDFIGNMAMHGKQDLSGFESWGIGAPEGMVNAKPVLEIDDFMVFDYDMTEYQAEHFYVCQIKEENAENCFSGAQRTSLFSRIDDNTLKSVEQEDRSKTFMLYPNPTKGTFTLGFTLDAAGDVSYQVHDLGGRILFEGKRFFQNGKGYWDIGVQLPQGLYQIYVGSDEWREARKLIIK